MHFQPKSAFIALFCPIGWVSLLCALAMPVLTPAQTDFATLTRDGSWCWFSDPRALFHNGTLYFGCVRSDGHSVLNEFNLKTGTMTNLWESSRTQFDDHCVCAVQVLPDGKMIALYARHITDPFFCYRISTSTNPVSPSDWGAEQQIPSTGTGLTYCNPFPLTAEGGKIYSFSRNLNFNPTVFTSTDGGETWSLPQIVIQSGSGSVRPYVKYCSNGSNRIDFLYTDGHPRDVTNSLYHMYYQGGNFYKTDGTFIKSYANLLLNHDAGERGSVIYQYNDAPQSDPNQWIPTGRAWCWEIARDTNGHPMCVFQVQVGTDNAGYAASRIFYYYARWTGTNWQKRFIAQAGRGLYAAESDYGGGMALDPQDPNVIYLSSNAQHPFDLTSTTNVPLAAHYEIYKGATTDGGLTFTWSAITTNSTVDNIRPYVPRRNGGEPCVLWVRGTYNSYTSFYTEIVGLFTTRVPDTNAPVGEWIADADGLWSDASKWGQGVVPDSSAVIADFSELNDMSANHTVTLDSSRTVGGLKFGDMTGLWNWLINSSGGSTLTLTETPLITVDNNTATLSISLAGTGGFTKIGSGTLVLNASNSLSGTLNLDSGGSSANDGAVRITSSAALAHIGSPIYFRDNTGSEAVGSLQLDGSNGGITVNQQFYTSCRNNGTIPTFESLAGTNTLAGTNFVQVGGTNVIYQADAGSLLRVTAPIQYVGSYTATRTFTFTGDGDVTVSGAILKSANSASVNLLKTGSGSLLLNGDNTFIGTATVAAGTLGGTGIIPAPMTVQAGATLAPGAGSASVGTLVVDNPVTLQPGSLTRMKMIKSPSLNNVVLRVNGTLTYGGTLVLTNLSGTVTAGDIFPLFYATSYTGAFSSIAPATPGVGLMWNTNNLSVNGTLSVELGNVNPQFSSASLSGTNLVFSGLGGAAGAGYSVIFSTNLFEPLTNWTVVAAGIFDTNGSFIFTNNPSTSDFQKFFALRIP